jgi:hypothetical protein
VQALDDAFARRLTDELAYVTKHHSIGQTEVLAEIEPIKDSPTVIA